MDFFDDMDGDGIVNGYNPDMYGDGTMNELDYDMENDGVYEGTSSNFLFKKSIFTKFLIFAPKLQNIPFEWSGKWSSGVVE